MNPPLPVSSIDRIFMASCYASYSARVISGPGVAGVQQLLVEQTATLKDGRQIFPFSTSTPIQIGQGAAAEIVTPSAVQATATPGVLTITVDCTNAHGAGDLVTSGTHGVQEALNDAMETGGGVVLISDLAVTFGDISTATGNATVTILDLRTQLAQWGWSGEAFVFTLGIVPGFFVILQGATAPDAEVGVGVAGPGALFIDVVAGEMYINTGSAGTPDWKQMTHE